MSMPASLIAEEEQAMQEEERLRSCVAAEPPNTQLPCHSGIL